MRNVAVCKETFNLYFYEADSQNDLPEWNAVDFTKVDTIAADRRFKPGEDQTNKETREIGPLKKKGLFIAIQVPNILNIIRNVIDRKLKFFT